MIGTRVWAAALPVLMLTASCGKPSNPIIIGSKNGTEQILLGEIIAQHVERRLNVQVVRRLAFGDTGLLYQSLLSGDVTVYPEYTGLIESEILKERASEDPHVVLERSRSEIRRTAPIEVLDPLGFDSPVVMVVPDGASDIRTLSEAARGDARWKLGVSFDFQRRMDGLPALSTYHLPSSVSTHSMEQPELFAALEKGDVNIIAARATDGHLNSPGWRILEDDRKVFPPYEACLMVRQDRLAEYPKLRAALAELSGMFSAETMRKLNAQVDIDHRAPRDVAADFLAQAGLR